MYVVGPTIHNKRYTMKTIATRTYSEKRKKNVTEEFYSSLQCSKCFVHNAHIQIYERKMYFTRSTHTDSSTHSHKRQRL